MKFILSIAIFSQPSVRRLKPYHILPGLMQVYGNSYLNSILCFYKSPNCREWRTYFHYFFFHLPYNLRTKRQNMLFWDFLVK